MFAIIIASSLCPASTFGCAGRSRSDGGFDFPIDPALFASDTAIFWTPVALPDVLGLQPFAGFGAHDPFALTVDLAALPGIVARKAEDGTWHGVLRTDGVAHQLWLARPPAATPGAWAVILPLDLLFTLRVEAALRLWRLISGQPPARPRYDMPLQTRRRHTLRLRVLDARFAGATQREVGEVMFGFSGDYDTWLDSDEKSEVRSLEQTGLHNVRGGYRDLLRYPIRS
jgi:hypothetical protein